jgi:hypothetical protein
MGLPFLIKTLDESLYYEFVKEKMSETKQEKSELEVFIKKMEKPKFIKDTPLGELKKVSQLAYDHPVKKYIDNRKIPPSVHYKLFYAPKFKQWVNSMIPDKLNEKAPEEPRLVIPFLDKDKNLFGFQGRSFNPHAGNLRYITIMLDDSKPRIFGLDTIDESKTIYVTEGPIDSTFLPNAIATAGGDILTEIQLTSLSKERIVIVYDNEPRNIETVKKIAKCIEAGYKVCIWDSAIQEKDINDMVLAGRTPEQVKNIIDENTKEGIEAKLFLTVWRRC